MIEVVKWELQDWVIFGVFALLIIFWVVYDYFRGRG